MGVPTEEREKSTEKMLEEIMLFIIVLERMKYLGKGFFKKSTKWAAT